MLTFLMIFAICIVGGFLSTSLLWIFFWAVGIFETPASVTRLLEFLHIVRKPQYQEAMSMAARLDFGLAVQAGKVSSVFAEDMLLNSRNTINRTVQQLSGMDTAMNKKENIKNLYAAASH